MKHVSSLCIVMIFCGCSAVYNSQLIGERPTDIGSEKDEWEGTWTHSDGAMAVTVVDGSNGVLKVGWVEVKDGDMKCESADVYLRGSGSWTFANIKPQEESNQDHYVWARIERKERQAILWAPDVRKFKALVQQGKLPGSVDAGDVILGNLESNHLEMITSETNGVLFDWDEPFILIKTGN